MLLRNYILFKMVISNLQNEEERYERKFLIPDLTLEEVEQLILTNRSMFSRIFYERMVNNIYLDFEDKGNYTDNIVGNSQRLKIRIRWYGKSSGLIENPILELKIKKGDILKKLSFPLKQFKFDKRFSKKILQKEIFNESNLPQWLNETLKLAHPTLLNSYKRTYFLSANKKYRITLDRDLVFFAVDCNSFGQKIKEIGKIVLEIKYHKREDKQISQITQDFPFRLTKSSKYVSGIEFYL